MGKASSLGTGRFQFFHAVTQYSIHAPVVTIKRFPSLVGQIFLQGLAIGHGCGRDFFKMQQQMSRRELAMARAFYLTPERVRICPGQTPELFFGHGINFKPGTAWRPLKLFAEHETATATVRHSVSRGAAVCKIFEVGKAWFKQFVSATSAAPFLPPGTR